MYTICGILNMITFTSIISNFIFVSTTLIILIKVFNKGIIEFNNSQLITK